MAALGRWVWSHPWTIAVLLVFASLFYTYNANRGRADEAHRLATSIIVNGAERRAETCDAFFKLYAGKREDLIYQFRQIDSPLTRQFFTLSPKQIAEARSSYLPRYHRWRNSELPSFCPQRSEPVPSFPKVP